MKDKYRHFWKGIKYKLFSRHRYGFGIHSPFVFEFITEVLRNSEEKHVYAKIEGLRKRLRSSQEIVSYMDPGSGSVTLPVKNRKITDIAKAASISSKYGKLIYRIVEKYTPETIVEIGTSLGISTLYLSKANEKAQVYTLEGAEPVAKIAQDNFSGMNANNIQLRAGLFKDSLPEILSELKSVDLVFFDGNHTKDATLDYFNQCLDKAGNQTIFIFDDIHWSEGMEDAWNIIKANERVSISIDLFRIGIVFFNKGLTREDFIIRY
ncbi:MAG: SAM-dependent methyltransferase [Bacteroidetes bacterium]|nr:MAG: SAM-dependent methyltransferase [Bacteroidota bacterium]